MTYTVPKNAATILTRDLTRKFNKSVESLMRGEISITYGKSILNLNELDTLRLIYECTPVSGSERIFKKFLIKNFVDAEKACPGSGFIATISFLKAVEKKYNLEETLEELSALSSSSRRGTLKDLNNFLDQLIKDKNLLEISKKILNLGGFSAACTVETTYELSDRVTLDEACSFKVRLDSQFSAAVRQKSFKKSNANVIIADGIIEKVSEIHHILEHFSLNKEFCFFICRGYEKDVTSTLATNFMRGALNIIPGVLVPDVESINSLKDICVISNSDLISSLKGDKFSSFDLDSITKVDSIWLNEKFLEIQNNKEYPRVVSLVENLKNQIFEELNQDKIDLLEKRIACLSPRKLKIYFSNQNKDSVGIKKDRLKIIIAMINNYCSSGKIDFKSRNRNDLICDIIFTLEERGINSFPAQIFFEGIQAGIKNAKMINNTNQVILLDS